MGVLQLRAGNIDRISSVGAFLSFHLFRYQDLGAAVCCVQSVSSLRSEKKSRPSKARRGEQAGFGPARIEHPVRRSQVMVPDFADRARTDSEGESRSIVLG